MGAVDGALGKRTDDDTAGTPLFLAVAAQNLAQWTSYDGVKFAINPSVRGLITDLFERLEATHGKHLVRAVLAFLTLCRRSGVSEAELVHLLSLDDDVLADIYEWWVTPMRTCPPLVPMMLLADLAPYLSRRGDGSGQALLSWYHRQVHPPCLSLQAGVTFLHPNPFGFGYPSFGISHYPARLAE